MERFFRALQIAEKSAGPSTAAVMFYLYGLTCDKRNTNTSVLYSRIFLSLLLYNNKTKKIYLTFEEKDNCLFQLLKGQPAHYLKLCSNTGEINFNEIQTSIIDVYNKILIRCLK